VGIREACSERFFFAHLAKVLTIFAVKSSSAEGNPQWVPARAARAPSNFD
jgi:hypothetical protein